MPISFLVDVDGKIPVTRDVSQPLSFNEGLACDKDGRLIITDTPSTIIYSGGIPRSPEGYLVVSGGGGGTTGGPGGGGSSGAFLFLGVEVQVALQALPATGPIVFSLLNYV